MEYKTFPEGWVVRLDPDDEVTECLTELVRKEDIQLAEVSGLGAAKDVIVGLFNTATKEYGTHRVQGQFELAHLTGNITRKDGEPYLHIHATASNPLTGELASGHLSRAVISATAEIFVRRWDGAVGRKFSDRIGLNLLEF